MAGKARYIIIIFSAIVKQATQDLGARNIAINSDTIGIALKNALNQLGLIKIR